MMYKHDPSNENWIKSLKSNGMVLMACSEEKGANLKETMLDTMSKVADIKRVNGEKVYFHHVDFSVRPEGTHGIGRNGLHIDYVSHSAPPKYIAIGCLRPDPHGGGESIFSDISKSKKELSEDDKKLLECSFFSYFYDSTGVEFGEELKKFPVFDGCITRYTEKASESFDLFNSLVAENARKDSEAYYKSYLNFTNTLNNNIVKHLLTTGEFILFDQQKYLHGRMQLGEYQDIIPKRKRRMLIQVYGN